MSNGFDPCAGFWGAAVENPPVGYYTPYPPYIPPMGAIGCPPYPVLYMP